MNELFQIEETKSPRLKWLDQHGFMTHEADHLDEDPWMAIIPMEDHKGNIGEIMAEWCGLYEEMGIIGYGNTEQDAIDDCAAKMKIPLWNEQNIVLLKRQKWIDFHGVWTSDINGQWIATAAGREHKGATEDEAMDGLAAKLGIPTWNES